MLIAFRNYIKLENENIILNNKGCLNTSKFDSCFRASSKPKPLKVHGRIESPSTRTVGAVVFGQKKVTAAADEVVTKPTTTIPNGSEGSDFFTSTTKDDSASLTTSEHRYGVGLLGSS